MDEIRLGEVLADCQIDLDLEHDLQGNEMPCPYRRKRQLTRPVGRDGQAWSLAPGPAVTDASAGTQGAGT